MNADDDNKVEIDLSHRSNEDKNDDYNSGAPYNSGNDFSPNKIEMKNIDKQKQAEDGEYDDPYAQGRTSDSKIINADKAIKLEQINVRQLEGAQNQNMRSDDQQFAAGEESFKGAMFQKNCCFGQICSMVRKIIYAIGVLLALPNVALDLAYIAKSSFYNKAFFVTLITIVMMRIIIVIVGFQGYLYYQLGYKPMMSTSNYEDEGKEDDDSSVVDQNESHGNEDGTRSRRYKQVRQQGMTLYLSMNSLMLLGTFRLLPNLFFAKEVATGYAVELIFNLFPTFLVQMFNNTDQPALLSSVQSTSLGIKMFLILNYFIEIVICIWEISNNRRMRKLKIQGFEKITEEEKRRRFSRKFGLLGLVSALVWLVILLSILIISDGRVCDQSHAMESGVCVPCIDPLCQDCYKDSQECKNCPKNLNGTAYFLSEQAQCRACDFGCNQCEFDGVDSSKCLKCSPNYYLSQDRYCKQCVNNGCKQCADRNVATGTQKCVECDTGYYLSSGDELCRACYEGCAQCADNGSGGHRCMECEKGYFLSSLENQCMKCDGNCDACKDNGAGDGKSLCTLCSEGFREDGGTCQDCNQDDKGTDKCGICDEANVCIECQHGYYLDRNVSPVVCKQCSESIINCVDCKQYKGETNPTCNRCDSNIAQVDRNGQCLQCKEGWTLDKNRDDKQQCMCNEILNTENGYKCQTCEQTIEDCHTCQYTLDPLKKLQTFVGQWNESHSGQVGKYGNRAFHPADSQHIVCTKPGSGLIVIPGKDGQEVFKKCGEVFKGCVSCAKLGLAKTLSCDKCEENGWYRYRSGANNRCGKCIHIPNRPGMEFCEQCNEHVCNKCKLGYHKLMGGCFKCYFDWQCDYF